MTMGARLRWVQWSIVVVLAALAVVGPSVPGTLDVDLQVRLLPPTAEHWMGTDALGRDVLARTVAGTSLSLRVSVAAWLAALGLGLLLGAMAGYYANTPFDWIVSWLIALAYVTPFLILLVGLLGVIGPGLTNAYLVLILFAWAAPARQTRVAVRTLRQAPFVTAARSFGFTPLRMFRDVVLPSAARPAVIASIALLPEILALDAALSFFGLGVQPPTPSLGKLIADGIQFGAGAWWLSLFPVSVLAIVCLALRFLVSSRRDLQASIQELAGEV